MRLDKSAQTFSIVALLVAAVAVLPLASSPASAQMAHPDNNSSYGLGDTITSADSNGTGKSFLAVFGASLVEGAKVTGVVVESEDEVSVTVANENETGRSDPVTIVAFAGKIDMMSLMMHSMMNGSGGSYGDDSFGTTNSGGGLDYSGRDPLSDFAMEDPGVHDDLGSSKSSTELFKNIKTGSSVIQEDWTSPQTVTVTLVNNGTDSTTVPDKSDTTFVLVLVFPYTEEATGTTTGEGRE